MDRLECIAFDLDGTLVEYGDGVQVNHKLIDQVIGNGDIKTAVIVTNQGGIPLGYRTAFQFVYRLDAVVGAIIKAGGNVPFVVVSLWHSKSNEAQRFDAEAEMSAMSPLYNPWIKHLSHTNTRVFRDREYRKPSGEMTEYLGIKHNVTAFYGDSDDDEGEAAAAGVPFIRVDRFTGG